MGLRSKTVTIASAVAGLAVFSQAPEFAQQYRQRIGGAVEELKTVVVKFDEDATNSKLSREQALDQLIKSPVKFSSDHGNSMKQTITRFEHLAEQRRWLENSDPLTRPLFVLKYPDQKLLKDAWEIFEPAVPLTTTGGLYGGAGALLALLLARLGISSNRAMRRKKGDKILAKNLEPIPAIEDPTIEPNWQHFAKPETGPETENETVNTASPQAISGVWAGSEGKTGIPGAMQVAPGREKNVSYLQIIQDNKVAKRKGGSDIAPAKRKTKT